MVKEKKHKTFENNKEVANPIILFDGECNLCNGTVQFIIKHDPDAVFRFASLLSEYGQGWIERCGLKEGYLDSLVLIDNGQVYTKSDAVMGIATYLNLPWSLFRIGRMLPHRVRDGIYDILATHRYRLFGRQETCMVPSQDIRSRFLE